MASVGLQPTHPRQKGPNGVNQGHGALCVRNSAVSILRSIVSVPITKPINDGDGHQRNQAGKFSGTDGFVHDSFL